jgi:flagellar biosynthesis anti-sigma factor FlgM
VKIEDTSGLTGASEAQKAQKIAPAFELFKAYGAAMPMNGTDQAQMSEQAQEIQKYTEKLKALPDIREEKVQPLTQRLQAGEYSVNVDNISEMMFRMAELDNL